MAYKHVFKSAWLLNVFAQNADSLRTHTQLTVNIIDGWMCDIVNDNLI